jgi:tetratricopeptide (TPR) repeat protein
VTLVLQARWDPLFYLLDRAIRATDGQEARAELLEEAALVARDFASDAERAATYLKELCDLRPDDASASVALEHLYDRLGRTLDLAELLGSRATRFEGAARRELQRRIAILRLDLGDAEKACTVIDAILADGAAIADVADLLERLVRHPGQDAAVELLCAHYEGLGRIEETLRIIEGALDSADDLRRRSELARELVRLRVLAADGAPGVFARASARIESDVAKRPALASTSHRAVLLRALAAAKRAKTDADFADATDGAWRALEAVTTRLLDAGEVERACCLLHRGASLPFERTRRRDLLRRAAELSADLMGDAPTALRLFGEIFRQDSDDPIAVGLVDRFASLLRAAGREDRVAQLWEEQARHRGAAGKEAEARGCWLLAAEAWERGGSVGQAIAAYDQGAALGSEPSFEALARIHESHARWSEAAAALEWLYVHAPPPGRVRHALRLAHVYVELDRSDRARACLEEALCAEPDGEDAEAVRTQLLELYERAEAWRPLVEVLSALGHASPRADRRVALLRGASEILRAKLDASAEAAELLALAAACDPRDAGVRLELAALLEAHEQWNRAADVLRERLALFGDHRSKERALLHHRLARVLVRAKDEAGALTQVRLASKMLPAHPPILHDLGRMAFQAGDLDLAEQTYRALLIALRHPVEAPTTVSRAEALLELSRVALRKGSDARAADLADSALESALDAGEDSRAFERALGEMNRYDLLVRTLVRHAERAGDVAARALALRDLVEVWKSQLDREPELGTRLRRCAQAVRSDLARSPSAHSAAWAALWSVHASLGDETILMEMHDRLAPILQDEIAHMAAGADRARLRVALARMLAAQPAQVETARLLVLSALEEDPDEGAMPGALDAVWRVGDALERAGDPRAAAQLYESMLDRRPTNAETAGALARRLEAVGSARLADALELCMSFDAKTARTLAPRVVTLREAQAETAGIARVLEAMFATDPEGGSAPEDRALLRRLVDAHDALGAVDKMVGVLDRAVTGRPHDADLCCMRAAVRERLGDVEGAVSDLLHAGESDGKELEVVLPMLARITAGQTGPALDAYVLGLVDLLVRAKRPEDAKRELAALLARHPRHIDGLERMASLAKAQKAWDQAVEVQGQLVLAYADPQGTEDAACLAQAVSDLVDVCQRAGRPADAREPLEAARRLLSESTILDYALERIYEAAGDWTHVAALLVARAEQTSDVAEKAGLLLRAATLLTEQAGHPSSALPLIERARTLHPESIEATLAWARVQTAVGRTREALPALEEVARRNRGKKSPALAAVYLEIGKAHLADDDLVEALEALKAGFSIEWQCGELAMLVGLVALDLGDEKAAERALLAVAMAAPRKGGSSAGAGAADKVRAFYHLAALAHANGDHAKARRWVTKVVAEDPNHVGARVLLEKLDSYAPTANVASR